MFNFLMVFYGVDEDRGRKVETEICHIQDPTLQTWKIMKQQTLLQKDDTLGE
ncbi:hypothetical protein HanIR_Chr15g0764061 [Helianthus annuus]|nr:hypothetical protein HanIR_Chr15g0764061 [Helianthus annuus]